MRLPHAGGLFEPVALGASLRVYITASSAVRALGVLRAVVLAWLMVQWEFGAVQLVLLLSNLLFPIASFGLSEGLLRFVPQWDLRGDVRGFLAATLGLGASFAAAVCAALYLLAPWIGPSVVGAVSDVAGSRALASVSGEALLRMVSLIVAVLIPYHFVLAILRARRMFRAASLMDFGAGVLFTVLAVVLVVTGGTAGGVVSTYALSCGVIAAGFGVSMPWRTRNGHATRAVAGDFGAVLGYSAAAGLAALCWHLLLSYPALHVQRVAGPGAFATFDLMRSWTQLTLAAALAVAAPVASAVIRRWEESGAPQAMELLNTAHKAVLTCVIWGSMALALGRGAIALLLPKAYHGGFDGCQMLLCAYLIAATAHLLSIRLTLVRRSGLILGAWALGCVAGVLASHAWIQADDAGHAVLPAAKACCVANATGLIVLLLAARKHRVSPDRGGLLLTLGCLGPQLPMGVVALLLLALPLLAWTTPVLFSRGERARLLAFVKANV